MILWCIKTFLLVQLLHGILASNHPYRVYDMIPQGICKMRRIPLLDNLLTQADPIQLTPERGAILRQTWNSSSFKRFSDCKFYLQAPDHMGIYLTISKVQLRKNSRGSCIDSIVVKKSNEKKYQFCDLEDDEELKVFSDDKGRMRITVNLDTTLALPTLEDTLEVQFVATVRRKCDLEGYWRCREYVEDSCINKVFFGDNYINCPDCTDEKSCTKDSEQIPIMDPSNVFLSAIISLFATMVVFGGCLWCLYRYRHCIASCTSNSAGVVRSNRDSIAAVDQVQVELHTSANDVQPSAPPDDDKDLPPSYDSLFPSPSAR